MPKQNGRKPRSAARTAGKGAGKQILIDDRIRIGMGMLSPDEREAVREAITSRDRLRRLVQGAQLAGSEGKLRVADVTPELRLVFRETARQIRLLELVTREAFDSLGITVSTPKRAAAARRADGVGKVLAANP